MDLPRSGTIVGDEALCTGCGVCELICSLSHHGLIDPSLSGIRVQYDPFADSVKLIVCQQCASADCYLSCPLRDEAFCIDQVTGARYIQGEMCNGCGRCFDACPFDPPRLRLSQSGGIAFKCDLCRDSQTGPLCVQYCKYGALRFVTADLR